MVELNLTNNPGIVGTELSILVSKCEVEKLYIAQCKVTEEELEMFTQGVAKESQLVRLQLFFFHLGLYYIYISTP